MVNFHLAPQSAAERKIRNFEKKRKIFKKEKKLKFLSKRSCLKTSEFMPAASLASLTDFKVSNSEKIRNFRKKQKFPKKSEILGFGKILKKLFNFFVL